MAAADLCDPNKFTRIKGILLESHIPVFIVPGDNEWNDCGNAQQIEAGWTLWTDNFMHLEDNWIHSFPIVRQRSHPENFYLVHKRTLFFGLNIVGGRVHDEDEWIQRLRDEYNWVVAIVQENVPLNAEGIIIMAHAHPTSDHRHFFNPLQIFTRDNEIPTLYLNGDGHVFQHNENFFDRPNFLQIQHEGGTRNPILKILADPEVNGPAVTSAFQYDRQL
jgi:hypothetical protein